MNGAEDWFVAGQQAMETRDWKYGVECLSQAVRLQPDELEYRKQKHRCCRRRLPQGQKLSSLETVKLAAIQSRLITAQMREDWVQIDSLAEDAIAITPWDGRMFACIADAATQLDRYELARYAWTSAIKLDRGNGTYYRSLGGLLQAHGEYEEAKSCFRQIQQIDPTGRIAEELLRAVDIAAMMDRQGYARASNSRDVEVAAVARQEAPQVDPAIAEQKKQRLELQEAVELAESHVRRNQYAMALETYQAALRIAPDNESVRRRAEDVELAFLKMRAFNSQNVARQHPDCQRRRDLAAKVLAELTSREHDVLTRRVNRDPTDRLQAFRLADLYRRTSEPQKAISLFEKVCDDPDLKAEALIGLGECWIKAERAELGRKYLIEAVTLVSPAKQPSAFKLAHYWLGRVYEFRSQITDAIHHFQQIVTIDPVFRDASSRLTALKIRSE
ncbi:MAG: hypothetical protein R3C49_04255 [Planctomycetaceae bacterium]